MCSSGDLPETPTTDFAAGDHFAAEELLSLAATTSQKVASSSGGHSKAILGAILVCAWIRSRKSVCECVLDKAVLGGFLVRSVCEIDPATFNLFSSYHPKLHGN